LILFIFAAIIVPPQTFFGAVAHNYDGSLFGYCTSSPMI
jgi:hypothetical protein